MKRIDNQIIHVFDVDETLVMWDETSYTSNQAIVDELIKAHHRGHFVIVHSAGGVDWAERIVKELGLVSFVDVVMKKASWYWDDKDANEWMQRCYRDGKSEK